MLREFVLELQEIGAIKHGEFKLKSGVMSPIYIDLRRTVSSPKLLRMLTKMIWEKVKERHFDYICGVPYTALPFATTLSLDHNIPMVMRRKEVKEHGTRQAIEGVFEKGKNCLVVEDLITSGMSVFETVEALEEAGLVVTDIVAFLDREAGGRKNIESLGYKIHTLITLSKMLEIVESHANV
ncbi:MAG: orotate phosphoribosyltransferase [Chlamydiales bacterium]|nr:orotate phosphoribosyltransferase [Chlamydiales bacterium]